MSTSKPASIGRVAVLTGDVVASSALEPDVRTHLPALLRGAASHAHELCGAAMPLEVDVFRGDGWQLLLLEPRHALRAALLMRAALLAGEGSEAPSPFDTRVALGVGPIDAVPSERVSEGSGEAYRSSGRALDEMGDRRLAYAGSERRARDWDLVLRLLDELVTQWTARQARAVLGALQGWRQDRIAELWTPRVSQPTVANHLRAAHWEACQHALSHFESTFAGTEGGTT